MSLNNPKNKQKREYRFLNKIYKMSQQGKLTMKRIRGEKLHKIAFFTFIISIIVLSALFTYLYFFEKAYAENQQQSGQRLTNHASSTIKSSTTGMSSNQTTPSDILSASSTIKIEITGNDTNTLPQSTVTTKDVNVENSKENTPNTSSKNIIEKTPQATDTIQNNAKNTQYKSQKTTDSRVSQNSQDEGIKISSLYELAFINAGGTSVFDSPETRNEITKLKYGKYVKIMEEKEFNQTTYTKIIFLSDENTQKEGWIRSVNLTNIGKLLLSSPDSLQLNPIKKVPAKVPDVRGIYISRATASSKENLEKYAAFVKRNNLNALVIDVKDDEGTMLFKSQTALTYSPNANKDAAYTKEEIKQIIFHLKLQGIYLIARIVCFKDPTYARTHMNKAIVYKDTGEPYMGVYRVPWASAYDRELWDYNIAVAKEAIEVGFDEIQYDYVRFPELTKDTRERVNLRRPGNETMAEAIYKFLVKSKKELEPYNVPLAVDIFGLVPNVIDDLGIGQHWELISNTVDYVCPMVYPSHYANGSFRLPIPDAYPYETVYNSVSDGIIRNRHVPSPARIRPWIQAFTATWVKGHITYTEKEIRKQIQALKDLGINEYMLWNASNRYIEMRYE
jgi:hypothetical protein